MNKHLQYAVIAIFLTFLLSACKGNEPIKEASPEEVKAESKKANDFFDSCYYAAVNRNPELQTTIGIKKGDDQWTDRSDEFAKQELQIAKNVLKKLRKQIDAEKLDDKTRISYHCFEYDEQQIIDNFKWRFYSYPVNQVNGFQRTIPEFLINKHRIEDAADAKAYIARLNGMGKLFDQLMDGLKVRDSMQIIPPVFVFPMVIKDCRNIISGQPFDNSGKKSALFEDFTAKVYALKAVDGSTKSKLIDDAKNALIKVVKPAYINLINYLTAEAKKASTDDGIWKLSEGKAFYDFIIKQTTTADISPDNVLEIGESDLKRIHDEIATIMDKVEYKDKSLPAFYDYMENNSRFYFSGTPQGREEYISEANNVLNSMKNNLDRFFKTLPKADIEIRAIEANSEKSFTLGFYKAPSESGKQPGICYFNLSDMKRQPIYQIESSVYHEGIPGYHIEVALAQELKDMPAFRRYRSNIAYEEGWALYAEYFPKEYGFYTDPYSDYGRLANEAIRAAALVVDVGINYKHWSKEKALQYLFDNAPYSEDEAHREIERCLVCPAGATGYKIGMSKIVQLRERAKKSLGTKFDIREFHDVILTEGPLPLSLLEDNVNFWINDKFGKVK